MKIGLYDINKSSYGKIRYEFPEIDLMKVYSYYKKNKNNVIELCEDYKKYKDYDLFYVFNNKRHVVSKDLLKLQNDNHVFLIGTCFYGDVWIPMDDEIEKCEPDITSYAAFLRTTILNNTLPDWVSATFTDNYYLRYFYPDWHWNLIPNKYKDKRIILYDYDLASNEEWQELYLRLTNESNRKVVCKQDIIVRDIQTLKFIIDNEVCKSRIKYPTKCILDIPEIWNNFKEYCDENFELLKTFPMNSLFIYQNHFNGDDDIDHLVKMIDICMYFLNTGREIYPKYDYSKKHHKYDTLIAEVSYYFAMRRMGTIYDMLFRRGDATEICNILQEKYPIFYEKIKTITRDDVKKKRKVWIYGER